VLPFLVNSTIAPRCTGCLPGHDVPGFSPLSSVHLTSNFQSLTSALPNSFPCHTSEKLPPKSNHCHTSENPLPQVLSLPHLQDPPGGLLSFPRASSGLPWCSASGLPPAARGPAACGDSSLRPAWRSVRWRHGAKAAPSHRTPKWLRLAKLVFRFRSDTRGFAKELHEAVALGFSRTLLEKVSKRVEHP